MAMLVTLAKFKEAIKVPASNTSSDSRFTEAIEDASSALINEMERNPATPQAVATKAYTYDGSGFLEIDDCELPTAVTMGGVTLAAGRWIAHKEGPPDMPVYSYLELPPFAGWSTEMGFERNEDVYFAQFIRRQVPVTVTANFGWPSIPDSIQRATIWTAASMDADTFNQAAGLAAKSVAEVAENYLQNEVSSNEPVPRRALALIEPYRRHTL